MEALLLIEHWALLLGVLMPVVVGLITKANASAALKASLLLTLEVVNGVLVEFFATPGGFDWRGALVNAFVAWVTGMAAYHGFLQHTVNRVVVPATARFGLGGSSSSHIEVGRKAA